MGSRELPLAVMQNPAEEAIMLLVHMRLQNADGIWLVLFAYFGRNTNRVACNFIGQKKERNGMETDYRDFDFAD